MLTDIQLCMSMRLDSDHRLAFSDQRICFWGASTRACFSAVRHMTYFRHQVAVPYEFFDLNWSEHQCLCYYAGHGVS